jgi:hypothetical protein
VRYKNVALGQCKQWYIVDAFCLDPNGQFESRGDTLHMDISNNAISHTIKCEHTAIYQDHDLPSPLRCTGGDFGEITLDITLTGTAPDFNINIEQLWYCLENPKTNVNP